jgi:L,D-transpeptidase ErfK/SrfK
MRQIVAAALAAVALAACGPQRPLEPPPPPPLEKITAARVQVPRRGELPPLVGQKQNHRIVPKETLLDVARDAGLGFHELQDANRSVDEWIPPAGQEVEVPTRWILPRTRQQGIVINVPEMRLYLYPQRTKPGDEVLLRTWAVAIGEDDTPTPEGVFTIRSKDKNPTWYVPASIPRSERPQRVMPPGPNNPMGEYRIRLSKGLYSIHGTDVPWAIGRQTTHGCIRLYPEDIGEFYTLVKPSMTGIFVYEPIKLGEHDGRVFVEVHDDVYRRFKSLDREAARLVRVSKLTARVDPERLRTAVAERRGVPVDVSRDVQTARSP